MTEGDPLPLVFPARLCETAAMDVPSRAGDTLAQPTRARVFSLLTELRRAASTDELAGRLGLHPNGVRTHLGRLQDEGLVIRERERRRRGRPRDTWTISPLAQPGGERPTAYADLGRWLARAIAQGETGDLDVEDAGRQIGHELAQRDDEPACEQQMHGVLVALGFRPSRVPGPGDRLTYRLGNCPYREAVRESQDVVCGLHRGMTRGLLDVLDQTTELTGFVPKDPESAGCLIELDGGLAAGVGEGERGTRGSIRSGSEPGAGGGPGKRASHEHAAGKGRDHGQVRQKPAASP